jgi:uncharacterized protein DUF3237
MTATTDIATTFLFELVAELEPRVDLGPGPLGRRMFDRVGKGSFTGPRLKGEVLPGSGDPLLRRNDGVAVIDARALLRTDDGAHILMTYSGRAVVPTDVLILLNDPQTRHLVDPSTYSIWAAPLFETGDPRYAWLNSVVAVASAELTADGVRWRVFQVG